MRELINHTKLHGDNELKSDSARLQELKFILEQALEEFCEIDSRFQWADPVAENRVDIWFNLMDAISNLENTCDKYDNACKVVSAAKNVKQITA